MSDAPHNRKPQEPIIPDFDQTHKLLDALFEPGDLIEVRPVESWKADNGRRCSKAAPSLWATVGNVGEILPQLAELNEQGFNVYFGVCPRVDRTRDKAGVRVVRVLWADLDDCRPTEAITRIREARLPAANAVVDSGHGVHLYWRLGESFEIRTDVDRAKVEQIVKEIAGLIGGDHVQNVDRLLRLPGFSNMKGRRNGHPSATCSIFRTDGDRVFETLEHAITWLPEGAQFRVDAIDNVKLAPEPTNGKPIPHGLRTWAMRKLGEHVDDRSGRDHGVCCKLFEKGCSRASIIDLVRDRSKFRGNPDYLNRTIREAEESAGSGFGGGTHPTSEVKGAMKLALLDELLAEPPEVTEWLVDNLLPSGGLSFLVSKPKVGKSTFARALALSFARSEPFLGRACHGGAVLYCGFEDKRAAIANHFRRMGASGAIVHVVTDKPPARDNAAGVAMLEAAIEQAGAVLCIIDTLARLIDIRDLNDYSECQRALGMLLDLARRTGCHILILHHVGKGDRADGDSILGSTALYAVVDVVLTLKRSIQDRTLSTRARYGEDMEPTVIELDPETHSVTAGGSVRAAQQADLEQEILDVLADADAPMTRAEIRGKVNARKEAVAGALRVLATRREVECTGSGRRNDPHKYSGPGSPPKSRGVGTQIKRHGGGDLPLPLPRAAPDGTQWASET